MPTNHRSAQRLLILDALNLIRRIDAVAQRHPKELNDSDQQSNLMIIQAARKLLRLFNPTHVVAVFDGHKQSWRHQCYPDYKANRPALPEPLQHRLPALQDALFELGIDSLQNDHVEADDLIATLASKAQHHGVQTTIVSTDSGFCQLIPLGVTLYNHFDRTFIQAEDVIRKYNLKPHQLIDYWALVGNSGLNLKGVTGIGKKSAQKLISTYGSLEELLTTQADDKLASKVQAQRHDAELSKKLITLRQDMQLGFTLRLLRWQPTFAKNDTEGQQDATDLNQRR